MKKVLFLTYYWPPSGKASLHWPLKMIKYLPEFGWKPAVLTVEDESFMQKDDSMTSEIAPELKVIKTKSIEPFEFYKIFTGKGKDAQLVASETISKENKSLTHSISLWIRMNLFIPDARIGWYPFAVRAGNKLMLEEKFDAIVSIGPPHSVHLAAAKIAKNAKIPFYPVFIDPWLNIAYYKGQNRSKLTIMLDAYLEKRILEKSRASIFVTETSLADYVNSYPFLKEKGHVLHWGFDEEKFANFRRLNPPGEGKILLHAGNIFDFQNPVKLWGHIKKRIDEGEDISLWFTGTVSPGVKRSISEAGLDEHTTYLGFISYDELIKTLAKADFLLVCAMEKRHFPGKLFEYLRTGIPIIAFGDDNAEVEGIINQSNAGMMFPFSSDGSEFFDKQNSFNTRPEVIKQFDRKIIAQKLKEILEGN